MPPVSIFHASHHSLFLSSLLPCNTTQLLPNLLLPLARHDTTRYKDGTLDDFPDLLTDNRHCHYHQFLTPPKKTTEPEPWPFSAQISGPPTFPFYLAQTSQLTTTVPVALSSRTVDALLLADFNKHLPHQSLLASIQSCLTPSQTSQNITDYLVRPRCIFAVSIAQSQSSLDTSLRPRKLHWKTATARRICGPGCYTNITHF